MIESFRPDIDVMHRILRILWADNRDYRKTELGMLSRVNYKVLMQYLSFLESRTMITVKKGFEGHEEVRITGFGVEVYEGLAKWVPKNNRGIPPGGYQATAVVQEKLTSGTGESPGASNGLR